MSPPNMCVVCGSDPCWAVWLENPEGYSVSCPTCGRYELDIPLHRYLSLALEYREPEVLEDLEGLQRAIAAANAAGAVARHTLDNWETEAREHSESGVQRPPS